MSAYKVVEFVDGVQLVPTNWFTSDLKFSYWPPSSLNQIKVNKFIASRQEPDLNWSKYLVKRIFCSSDSYQVGMSKLRQAEAISDLDSADDVNLKKRKRHHERTANLGLTELSPKSSKKNVHNLDVTHDYSLPNFPNICSAINNEFIRSLETTAVSPSHNLSLNQSMSNYDIEKEIKPKNCDHTEWQKKVNRELTKTNLKLDDISQQYSEIKILLEELKGKMSENTMHAIPVTSTDINFTLPFTDLKTLFEAETSINGDHVCYGQMVSILKSIGGSNLQYIINSVMKKIMINSVSIQFCYSGKNNKKYSFKNTLPTFLKAIIYVVQYHLPQCTFKEISDQIGRWLIQSKLRKTREEIKLQQLILTSDIVMDDTLDTHDQDKKDDDPSVYTA